MSVVVIGDANVDLEIRLPDANGATEHANPDPRLFGGGSAANTAAALARLGVATRFVGTVGDDAYGRAAVASLEQAGVDVAGVQTTTDSPTVTVITVVPPHKERLIYVWPPTGGAHGALETAPAVAAISGARWLHVSGICLRLTPARDALLGAMERARADDIPVSFDLNLRLENWGWDDSFRATVAEAVAHSDVIFGSAHDEIGPLGGLDEPVAAATALAGEHRLVVARLGADGAVACSADGIVTVPGIEVQVRGTVGAGDAFNAGFIAARLRELDIEESLRWGNTVAGLTITRPGARSTPVLSEVNEVLSPG